MSHVEDRWFRTVTGPDGRQVKEPKARNGIGLRYRVRYEDPDRKEHSESFARKADAEKFRTRVDADLLRGSYRDPDAGRVTLRKYAGEWLAAQRFDTVTREAVESRLRLHVFPVLGSRRLDELAARPSLLQAWLSDLRRVQGGSLAASSSGKVLTHLNTVMKAAVLDGRIAVNPCEIAGIKAPRPPRRKVRPWSPGQAAAVRAALPARLAAMVDAGTGLGLRQSEIFGLPVDAVDFLRRKVSVRQQVKLVGGRPHFALPKGKAEREVPLAAQTGEALAAHLAAFPAVTVTLPWHEPDNPRRHGRMITADLVFTNRARRALHRNGFNANTWRPAVKAAGLADERVNGCHMMRHLFASSLIAGGVDVRTVAEYLGHSDGGALVLKTYSHLMPDSDERVRRVLEDSLPSPARLQADGPQAAHGGRPGL
jgi:integrase